MFESGNPMSSNSKVRKRRRMEKDEPNNKEEEDRISALPDGVIDHIFSFLDMKDVARTSILSNRWRYLWISTLTLNFKLYYWGEEDVDVDVDVDVDGFLNFVDNVLTRSSSNSIIKFDVDSDHFIHPSRILKWVHSVLERRVHHLHLHVPVEDPLELPYNLFTSNIETFELTIPQPFSKVRLPNSICTAPMLKHLVLHSLMLPDGDANGELILSCPVLETLRISFCCVEHLKLLNISTPLLESLDFNWLHTTKDKYCKVKTCTPNLKSFSLRLDPSYGPFIVPVDYALENFPSLVSASICVCLTNTGYLIPEFFKCLMKILPIVSNVQTLELYASSIEILTDSPKVLEAFPHIFRNLKNVIVGDIHNSSSNLALLKFLKQFSHVETLVWKRYPYGSAKDNEDEWAANLAFQSTISCLKTFEIQNLKGTSFELSSMKWLLGRAKFLKRINIMPCKSSLSHEKLSDFKEKLLSVPLASSSASISFSK